MGLAQYGSSNWEQIRQNLLPTKTTAQLVNRYKNMSSTRAPDDDNPIKVLILFSLQKFNLVKEIQNE